MKKSGVLPYILLFVGISTTLAALIINQGIISRVRHSNGEFGLQKIDVSTKIVNSIQSVLDYNDAEKIQKELKQSIIAFSAADHQSVSANGRTYDNVRVHGTNHSFYYFHNLNISKGSFFTRSAEDGNEKVAIIETELAWLLFNTADVLDYTIKLYNEEFKIIGLSEKNGRTDKSGNIERDVMEKSTAYGNFNIYIPYGVMFEKKGNERLEFISIYTGESSINRETVVVALRNIGKDDSKLIITDYQEQELLLTQKSKIIKFIAGLVAIISMVLYLFGVVNDLVRKIRMDMISHYFAESLKKNRKIVLIGFLKLLVICAAMFVIFISVSFKPYLPRESIPDRLIDTDFFKALNEKNRQQYNINMKSFDLNTNMFVMEKSQRMTTNLTIAGLTAGYALSVFMVIIAASRNCHRTMMMITLFTVLSFILVQLFSFYSLSLPASTDLSSIFFFWLNLGIIVLLINQKTRVERGGLNDQPAI